MKVFDDFGQLEKEIMKRARKSLKTSVADEIKQTIRYHAEEDVYEAYTPRSYKRRIENTGGLIADDSLHSFLYNDVLTVRDEASPNGAVMSNGKPYKYQYENNLAGLIESGAPYPRAGEPDEDYEWMKPRPFMTHAQEEIMKDPKVVMDILRDDIE